MCTAISFKCNGHYFGRNLDLEKRYCESVIITPRNYVFRYKSEEIDRRHFAIIGAGIILEDYPLYYDATNEYGLSVAGLNFVDNAYLFETIDNSNVNLATYELIPYVLSKCKTVDDSIGLLKNIRLVNIRFRDELPNSELHWLISDSSKSITLEIMKEGIRIINNVVGVLTNNPPFEYQMMNLNNYMDLSNREPQNHFSKNINLYSYSRGMGAIGLPGDHSSSSRFVRAAFTKLNSVNPQTEEEIVTQFFHILSSVEQQEGCVIVGEKYERTQYSSCCNCDKCIYYYKTYENSQISAVNMYKENLESMSLISYEMKLSQSIDFIN